MHVHAYLIAIQCPFIDYDDYVQIFIFHNESGFYQRLGANASDTSVVIDNIAKDMTYRARIVAHNRAGDGVLSDIVFVGKTRAFLISSRGFYAVRLSATSSLLWNRGFGTRNSSFSSLFWEICELLNKSWKY